jgi:HD superfamily phosphodiesterase
VCTILKLGRYRSLDSGFTANANGRVVYCGEGKFLPILRWRIDNIYVSSNFKFHTLPNTSTPTIYQEKPLLHPIHFPLYTLNPLHVNLNQCPQLAMMDVTSSEFQTLYEAMTTFVNTCMSGHDPSHNPAHVHRVANLANTILQSEQTANPTQPLSAAVVKLAALLHDIGDRKYLPTLASTTADTTAIDPKTMVELALLNAGAPSDLATKVQTVVSHVSYTTECKDPGLIRRLIEEDGYPELAIVQDADRLDAIGAIGIGRTFTFLGAQGKKFAKEGEWEMGNCIEHFVEKLERLEGMMKTETGRGMARVRTERLGVFRGWWEEEMGVATGTV